MAEHETHQDAVERIFAELAAEPRAEPRTEQRVPRSGALSGSAGSRREDTSRSTRRGAVAR